MNYPFLKLMHIVGFILLGGGLIGVFAADLRSRQSRDIKTLAEACRYVAVMYDGAVVPGAIIAGISGLMMTIQLKSGFFELPWLTGMWALFVFEFVEGNTVTRVHFRRMLKYSKEALAAGMITERLRHEMTRKLPTFTHFLDLPLFFLIVTLGGLRPSAWDIVIFAVAAGVGLGAVLMFILTRIYKPSPDKND